MLSTSVSLRVSDEGTIIIMGDVKPQKNESFNSFSLYFLIKKAQEKKNEKRVKIVSAEMRKILTEFFTTAPK